MDEIDVVFLEAPRLGLPVDYLRSGARLRTSPLTKADADPDDPSLYHVESDAGEKLVGRVQEQAEAAAAPEAPPPPRAIPVPQTAPPSRGCASSGLVIGLLVGCGCLLLVVAVLAAILFPVFARAREAARQTSCISNMKQHSLALLMYLDDHNGRLPHSAIAGPAGTGAQAFFCTRRGGPEKQSFASVLKLYSREGWQCPSDAAAEPEAASPDGFVSYYYRTAVDQGCLEGFDEEADFRYPAQQMVLIDRLDFHSGGRDRGWEASVTLNAAFMDGHVSRVTGKSGTASGVASETILRGKGLTEPGWPMYYSYDTKDSAGKKGRFVDPTRYRDE